MSLAGAAAALGLPEALVERSAAARAAETGQSVDDILTAWAGGEAPASAPAPSVAPEPEPPETEPAATPDPEPVVEIHVPEPAGSQAEERVAATRAPVPSEVSRGEAAHLPEVITVPTAGIKERTNFVIPRWLTALMVAAPLIALFALGGSATGACGEGTELDTNVITGAIVNCDGSEFTGGGAGGGGTDYIALGGDIYSGVAVAGVNCSGCHGPNGQGSGTFPALSGVMTTFGACADHIDWVSLGSDGFRGRGDTTYGDTGKSIEGGMPGFASNLTEEQVAAVSAFERVRFGGANADETLVDCGLVEPAAGDGADGSVPPGEDGAGTEGEDVVTDPEASIAHGG